MKWIGLAAGGLLGTFARYVMSVFLFRVGGLRFPYGTLAVNLSGCFLIGFFVALGEEKIALSPEAKLFLITGFCGAYTTFSALILETATLAKGEGLGIALLNLSANIIFGFVTFRTGMTAGEML